MLRVRVASAVVALAVFLSALLYLPPAHWSLLLLGVVLAGAREWAALAGFAPAVQMTYLAATLALGVLLLLFSDFRLLSAMLYVTAALFWLLVAPFWLASKWRVTNGWLLGFVGWVVLVPPWLALVELKALSPWFALAVLALIWIADSAAYLVGRVVGRHRLAPSISPGKTWEGVAGALVAATVYGALAAAYPADALGRWGAFPWWPAGVAAIWLLTYLGILGDLFESWMKRQAGLKDSGRVLPGHGGVLDRIDSLTSTLPLVAFALLFANLPGPS